MELKTDLHHSFKPNSFMMEITTNFKISIPKPCHEDWNKMTPDEKGAFCKVCNKSVHDFTKKTAEEIKTILIDEMSEGKKVCGRFNEDQVEAPVQKIDTWSLNFQKIKKFTMALFLVFGTYLFNPVKVSAQKMGKVAYNYREPVHGEIAIAREPQVKKDSLILKQDTLRKVSTCTNKNILKGDVMVEPEEKFVTGGLRIETVDEPKVKGQLTIIETPPVKDSSVTKIVGDTLLSVEPLEVLQELPVMGAIAITEDVIEIPSLINPVLADSIQNIINEEFAVPESTFVETAEIVAKQEEKIISENIFAESISLSSYPNPSSNGQITLRYNLKKDGMTSILLYDMNGGFVRTFLQEQSLYASSYETKYDVSNLKNGIYICELISGQNKITTQ